MASSSSANPKRAAQAPANGENGAVRRLTLRRVFDSELREMMHAFGDDENPRPETVELLQELLLDYLEQMVKKRQRSHSCFTVSAQMKAM